MDSNQKQRLIQAALDARENAYCPFSHFAVGAAVLSENGDIFSGCNVEVSAYSTTLCAERNALFHAVGTGERRFTAVCIAGGKAGEPVSDFCPPCGVCRQALLEFAVSPETFEIILFNGTQEKVYTLSQLLPLGFKET